MSGFWGAEVEVLRQHGTACGAAAGAVESLLGSCASLIDGIEWIGPDADSFHERWGGEVRPLIEQMIHMLRADGRELSRHADAQDEASGGGDGRRAPTLPGMPIPSQPLPFPLPKGLPPILPPIFPPLPIPGDDFKWPITPPWGKPPVSPLPTPGDDFTWPIPPPWGKPPVPTVPDGPFDVGPFPFPILPLPRLEIPRCPVPRIDPDDLIIGIPPILTDCFPTPPPLPPLFPPPMTDCWPIGERAPLPMPENWPLPQPRSLPSLLPEPMPLPENWPLPQPLPRPLPIPDQWPLPMPLPRPDIYRL